MRGETVETIVGRLAAHAAKDPWALTTITAEERSSSSGVRPNGAKLAQLYAQVLPQAMELYSQHSPSTPSRAAAAMAAVSRTLAAATGTATGGPAAA